MQDVLGDLDLGGGSGVEAGSGVIGRGEDARLTLGHAVPVRAGQPRTDLALRECSIAFAEPPESGRVRGLDRVAVEEGTAGVGGFGELPLTTGRVGHLGDAFGQRVVAHLVAGPARGQDGLAELGTGEAQRVVLGHRLVGERPVVDRDLVDLAVQPRPAAVAAGPVTREAAAEERPVHVEMVDVTRGGTDLDPVEEECGVVPRTGEHNVVPPVTGDGVRAGDRVARAVELSAQLVVRPHIEGGDDVVRVLPMPRF